jgi:D-3-phosphoglycerate dehydrogenase / 2-oxoglutarate reductase
MSRLVVRTDGILPIEAEDIAALTAAGLEYREATCTTEDEVIAAGQGAAGLLVLAEPITARVLDALPTVKVVGRFGVGLDTIDVPAATERGVTVVYVPDANTTEVASHALALILALARRVPQLNSSVQAGRWSFRDGGEGTRRISEMTAGILGFGRIGRLVADSCRQLGFTVLVHDPFVDDARITAGGYRPVTLDELVESSDVVSVHVPLSPETRDILNAERISRMRNGAIVVNVSRGGLIDEKALAEAVASGRLAGAGIDTVATEPLPADSPLRGNPNILLTPHAAHYSEEAFRETVHRAFVDVARVLSGEQPLNPVN